MLDETPITTRRLLALRQFPGMATTELGELATIASNVVETSRAPGDIVAAPNGRVPPLHLVLDGRLISAQPDGAVLAWGPRTVFGALEVMAGRPVRAPVVAVKPTRTLQLAPADFVELLEDHHNLLSTIRRGLAGHMLDLAISLGKFDTGLRGRAIWPTHIDPRPLGMVDRLILLRAHLPFALRKLHALSSIALASEEVLWPEGSVLCRAGEPARGAIVILEGQAVGTRPGHDAIPLGPGNAIGRIETLAERGQTLTVEALGPVRALHGPGQVLFDLLEDNPDLALAMIETMAGELLDAAGTLDARLPWSVS